MVLINLIRLDQTDEGIFGAISTDDDSFEGVSGENPTLFIPIGSYPITIFKSPHFGYNVPLLGNTGDRIGIEMHPGNCPSKDSHGCILVATTRVGNFIEESDLAFHQLMNVLVGQTDISIVIS